ncbi:TRAP transporter large permease [Nitratireductor sp. XY-223]|uniref:TRAP transporter large permease n=1 Tax=Nitratireductor sp. XY-223 TaxID=2561926 RepID=UPI0010A9FDAE|nr:TRAP transporter large permease [Nitratireductor sp. XY-223]
MDPVVLGSLGLAAMLLLVMLRVPIAIGMATVGFVGMTLAIGWPKGRDFDLERGFTGAFSYVSFEPYSFIASFPLVAVPLFLMMGYVAYHAGFTRDLFDAARIWLAPFKGGLALASVVGCAMFAAVSGSSLATAAAMGKFAVPEMLRYKYDKGLATAVVAASGTLGSLIPPSILMILYGIFTEVSVGRLMLAGLIPGALSALIYMAMIWVRASINPELAPSAQAVTWRERLGALKNTWTVIFLFSAVMGGIYLGIVTPTEAAAVGAASAWLLGFISRRLGWQKSRETLVESVRQCANIFAIVLGAKIFVAFISLTGVASALTSWAVTLDVSPIWIVISLSLVYVILGTFMDPLGIMLLTLPVAIPVVEELGFNLIWFGVLMIKFLEIGLITPPIGLNVYILKGVVGSEVPLEAIFKGILWFLVMDVFTLALLIAFPQISLWLPSMMFG